MTQLLRSLGFIDAVSLVVGSIIGAGIFLKASVMAQAVGSPSLVMLAWVVAGVLSLAGAFAYAEIGSRYPEAGGEYVFLRDGYNPLMGFLFGWTRFWIGSPGSVAAYAVGAATFLNAVIPLDSVGGRTGVSLLFISFFTLLNCLTVAFGGRVQAVLTALKVVLIFGLGIAIFIFSNGSFSGFTSETTTDFPVMGGIKGFGAAMLAALWAYDGWNNLPMAAGEIKDPKRNVPRSLVIGTLTVMGIYLLLNAAYFYALPFDAVVTASSSRFPDAPPVASRAAQLFLGFNGANILSILFVVSALSGMHGSILTGARVPFAMARDGLFFKSFASLHPVTCVPVFSVALQGVISGALALSGTFDQLTDYVVFASWIFYALVTGSVFTLRRRPTAPPASYQTFGYPWLPGLFLVGAVLLLINTLFTSPRESFMGLTFVLLGIPAFYFFKRNERVV